MSAPDPTPAPVVDACTHCGERIVLVEYISGVQWMHQPAVFAGDENRLDLYCKLTVAASGLLGGAA